MSRRILLLIDDFNENRRIETMLRKVGFDVVGVINESSLNEQILTFGPDMIIAAGQSARLSALSVAIKLKEHRSYGGHVVLGFPTSVRITSRDLLKARVDRILDTPFRPEALLTAIAQLMRMDEAQLVDKWQKLQPSEGGEAGDGKLQIVKGAAPAETPMEIVKTLSREQRYQRIAKQTKIDKNSTTFQKNSVREHWKAVKENWDFGFLEDLRKLKVEFARALFGKKKAD